MKTKNHSEYSVLSVFEAIRELDSSEQGLGKKEAKKRLFDLGPNKLPDAKADSIFEIFSRQFKSPLIYILLVAGLVVFMIGETIDGLIILAVLTFNAIVGAIQEGKAQNTLLALKKLAKTNAVVIREGDEHIISDEDLVVGDIIILREGEKIPADARIIFSSNLKINESSLTGESNPVHKTQEAENKVSETITEAGNLVFKGTNVVSGAGRAVVIATGMSTFIGGITEKMMETKDELPLKKSIKQLSRFIIMVVLTAGAILATLSFLRGVDPREILMTVIAISVSVIPEGLPIVVTLVLATGVWQMSKRSVLVKKLQAVEALGQTSVIAVDKTGTITKNELMVEKVFVDGKMFEIRGFGYEPQGEIFLEEKALDPINHRELLLAGKIAILNSSAYLAYSKKEKSWRISGDPTEASIMVLAEKIGFKKEVLEKEMPKKDEIPFDYELKYHATLHKEGDGAFLSVVGSPESVLALSDKIWKNGKEHSLTEKEMEELKIVQDAMSDRGLRVVAFAYEKISSEVKEISGNVSELVFGGFFGIKDGLREDVSGAVARVKAAGIRLVMITGDYRLTAKAIAKEAGIYVDGDQILTGQEIENLKEKELAEKIESVSVFARVSPAHKLKIVNAYKLRGDIIAMTGDGVNDALSLISADVGVAMGKIGTEVAKEAADLILLDDNFGSIVSGVEEGRGIVKTVKKVILYLLATSMGEMLTIIGALAISFPLPILPAQILWLNLVTDGFLDVALAMDPKEDGLLKKKTQSEDKRLVDRAMIWRIIFMALPMAIGTLLLFGRYYENDLAKAWTVSLTTLAVFQWFNAWNCRSEEKSIFRMNAFSNKFLVGATLLVISMQLLAVYNPLLQKILRTVPLDLGDWLLILPVASSIVLVEEIRKFIFSRKSEEAQEK